MVNLTSKFMHQQKLQNKNQTEKKDDLDLCVDRSSLKNIQVTDKQLLMI